MHSKHTHTHIHTDDTLAHEYTQPQSLVFTIRLKYQIYNMTSSIIFFVAGAHTNAHSHPVTICYKSSTTFFTILFLYIIYTLQIYCINSYGDDPTHNEDDFDGSSDEWNEQRIFW